MFSELLIPPLATGPGVCATCRAATSAPHTLCVPCAQTAESAPSDVADVVVPISIAVKHGPFAHELWRYKELPESDTRRGAQTRLAAVLGVSLRYTNPASLGRPVPNRSDG